MRRFVSIVSSLIMVFAIANCSREKSNKPSRVSPELRFGPNKQGGGASCQGCPQQPAGQQQGQSQGQPQDGQQGEQQSGGGSVEAQADDAVVELPTKECRLNLPDNGALNDEQLKLRFCDSIYVESANDGSIDFNSIDILQSNTKENDFAGLKLTGQEAGGVVTATSESLRAPNADGKDLLVLTYALPDSLDKITAERDLAKVAEAMDLQVKINDEVLSAEEYEVRIGQSNLVYVRIINLDRVKNINFVVEIQYKKSV